MPTRRDFGKGIAEVAVLGVSGMLATRPAAASRANGVTGEVGSELPTLHVPARDIPSPSYLSVADQKKIAAPIPPKFPYPPAGDAAGWRDMVEGGGKAVNALVAQMAAGARTASVEATEIGGTTVYTIEPASRTAPAGTVWLDIHGGALIYGGGEACRELGRTMSSDYGITVWAVDYRMPPEHPYPAGLDDCIATYRALLKVRRPNQIIVAGASAGGNLAAALLLRARDEGLPMPAGAVMLSPEIDLTESGDSFQTNLGLDPLGSLMGINLLYAGGRDLREPYISPLYGRFHGMPPMFITAGTRDMFLSNAVRLHLAMRGAGSYAELRIADAMPHGGSSLGSEEDIALKREVGRFLRMALTSRGNRPRALELPADR